jgi:putative redox protein
MGDTLTSNAGEKLVIINITYRGELHCEATHGSSGALIVTDAPTANHGKGEAFSPTDLLATALGTCMMTVMGIAAQKLNVDLAGARAQVEKLMAASPSRRVGSLIVQLDMPANVPEAIQKTLETAAFTCPVKLSLHPDIAVEISFDWT